MTTDNPDIPVEPAPLRAFVRPPATREELAKAILEQRIAFVNTDRNTARRFQIIEPEFSALMETLSHAEKPDDPPASKPARLLAEGGEPLALEDGSGVILPE